MSPKVYRSPGGGGTGPEPASAGAIALLLPGMTLNATIFPPLGVPSLAVDFATTVLHPTGGGAVAREGMDLYARMLADRLRHTPEWGRTSSRIVVGHSFGGMLALAWLAGRGGVVADPVDGLVLVATTAGPMFDRVRLRLAPLRPIEWRIGIAPVMRLWNTAPVTRLVKRLCSRGRLTAQPVDFRRLRRTSDWALDLAGWRNTDWRAMRSFRFALAGFDVRAYLPDLRVPTIVLHGTEDTLFPLAVARDLARGLPRAELRVVRGAGHGLPLTHGADVARAVGDLLPV